VSTGLGGVLRTTYDRPVFSFAMIVADNAECVGVVAFARSDFEPGDVLPQGPAGNLRVVNVLES
jgi:hypothetical protein